MAKRINAITGTVNENGTINVNGTEVFKVKTAACEANGIQPFEHIAKIGKVAVKFVWDTRKATGSVNLEDVKADDFVNHVRDNGTPIDISDLEPTLKAEVETEAAAITKIAAEQAAEAQAKLEAENAIKAEAKAKLVAEKLAEKTAKQEAAAKLKAEKALKAAEKANAEAATVDPATTTDENTSNE